MTGDDNSHGEEDMYVQKGDKGTNRRRPPKDQHGHGTGQRQKYGVNKCGKMFQNQARGSGQRDKRHRLADGGWGESPVGQRTTLREDVWSW